MVVVSVSRIENERYNSTRSEFRYTRNHKQTLNSGVGVSEWGICSPHQTYGEQMKCNINRSISIFVMETPHHIFQWAQSTDKRTNEPTFHDANLLSNIHMLSTFIYVFPRVVFCWVRINNENTSRLMIMNEKKIQKNIGIFFAFQVLHHKCES